MSTEEELVHLRNLVAKKDHTILELQEQIEWFQRQVFGTKSERTILPTNQQDIFGNDQESNEQSKPKTHTIAQHERKIKGHGRNEIPDTLDEEIILVEVNESDRICPECNEPMCSCGEDVSFRLAVRSQFVKIKTVRQKYSCKSHPESGVIAAPVPPAYVPKGILAESAIAHSIIEKYEWHTPLARQEKKMEREGILVSATTLLDCQKKVVSDLEAVYAAIKAEMFTSDILYSDDTTIPVISNEKRKTKNGYFWTWSDGRKWAVFDYSNSRGKQDPLGFIGDWRGYLHSDAYVVYESLHKNGITPVFCWAHVRRKFFDSVKAGNKMALRPLSLINRLFFVERAINKSKRDKHQVRNQISKKIEATLWLWCKKHEAEILPSLKLGKALAYYRNQRQGLLTFLKDRRLSIDNNLSERNLRGIVIGRKNWLFAGNEESARRAAIFCTIIASCKLQGIDPKKYFENFMLVMALNPNGTNAEDLVPGKLKIS